MNYIYLYYLLQNGLVQWPSMDGLLYLVQQVGMGQVSYATLQIKPAANTTAY